MITRIASDLPSFKTLEFQPGLNVLLADKSAGATDRQTRNGAGKTSLIELIHFLLGSSADKKSIFRADALATSSFEMSLDLAGQAVTVARTGSKPSRVRLLGDPSAWPVKPRLDQPSGFLEYSNDEWKDLLGALWFQLPVGDDETAPRFRPSFRSLISYFVRRQLSGGFLKPTRQSSDQQAWDEQVAISYLLGLDWTISQRLQEHRQQEKTAKELRRAAREGDIGKLFARAPELRTKLAVAESKSNKLREELDKFEVVPQYRDLEREASGLTQQLANLNNDNTIDRELVLQLRQALAVEAEPGRSDVEQLYHEAGVVLPASIKRRFEEVEAFHSAIVENRKSHLSGELSAAEKRIATREEQQVGLDHRRQQIMTTLRAGGALESYNALRDEVSRAEADVEVLRQRLEMAERLDRTKAELDVEKANIAKALKDDLRERSGRVREAILAFESLSESLYEKEGSLEVSDSPNGPVFEVKIESQRSKGISNMQIFCFDMMLMELGQQRGRSPGFLVHDSHLFDGVDERQVAKALQLGARRAAAGGFQYIVTMNSDALPTEGFDADFKIDDHILGVRLTDAIDTGGLFGLHFE